MKVFILSYQTKTVYFTLFSSYIRVQLLSYITNSYQHLCIHLFIHIHNRYRVYAGGWEVAYSWWRHQMETFPCYWPFMRGIHRSPVISPHNEQWRGALIFSLISAWINCWVNNREDGNLRRYHTHYNFTVMLTYFILQIRCKPTYYENWN